MCYDDRLKKLQHTDKPDFQSEELSIDVEVTRAIDSNEGHRQAITNKYFGKGYTPDYIIKTAKNEKHFGNIFKTIGSTCYTETIVDLKDVVDNIVASVNKKTDKLNMLYTTFNNNWLYVFSGTSLLRESDITKIISLFFNNKKRNFDKIFINAMDKVYVVDSLSNLSSFEINDDQLKKLKKEAVNNTIAKGIKMDNK